MRYALLLASVFVVGLSQAQSITGKWKTIDDSTGEPRSIVEIAEVKGLIFGKVVKLIRNPGEDPDPVCDKCDSDDPRYNKKVIGMEIIQDLKDDGGAFSGGSILDPKNGKVYRAKLWLEGKELKVRGYWGPFYRTQTWQRAD